MARNLCAKSKNKVIPFDQVVNFTIKKQENTWRQQLYKCSEFLPQGCGKRT